MRASGALLPTRAEGQAAVASAALFAIAFPPFVLVGPVFFILVPLAIAAARAVDEDASWRASVRLGFWFGALAYGVTLYWIATALAIYTKLAVAGWLAAVLLLAMMTGLTIGTLHRVRRATRWPFAVVLPLVWVAGEFALEHLGDLAFPWLPLGLATAPTPLLSQVADLSGVHGASAWIAATSGLIVDMYLLRGRWSAVVRRSVVVLVLGLLVVSYGMWRLETTKLAPLTRVAIVQPNVPQFDKWQNENQSRIVAMLADGTRRALETRPSLVVWPEASLPDFLFRHQDWRDTLASLASHASTPILLGVLDVRFRPPARPEYFNGAMLVDASGQVRQLTYHKRRLVPVVERVPFIEPTLVRRYSEYFGGYAKGRDAVILQTPWAAVGPMICYESIFPSLARDDRRHGAQLLVNVTNDAWFGRTLGPYQHFAHARLRAVETRLGLVRAANTGISGYIDPWGRVQGSTPLFVATTATYLVSVGATTPPYVRYGDWVGWSAFLFTVAIVGLTSVRPLFVRHEGRGP